MKDFVKTSILVILFLGILLLTAIFITRTTQRVADIILYNGIVHTLNPAQPKAEAIAISGSRILGVGSSAEVRSAYTAKREIDLQGRAVFPGFIDAHAHVVELGASLSTLNLVGTRSAEEIAEMVKQRAAQSSPGTWINGRGWDQNDWAVQQFPTHEILDRAAPNNPVYLIRIDGHAVWVNARALEIAHITRETADPPGGKILRDIHGNPTGVLVDAAVELLAPYVPPPTEAEVREAVKRATSLCAKLGITEVHDMGADSRVIAIYKDLVDHHELPIRLYVAINGEGETWDAFLKSGPLIDYGDGMLTVRSIKLFADGALGSRGAALIDPYSDDPGNRGLTLMSTDEIVAVAKTALQHGFQVCTHAIGDRANHIVLNAYERALQETGKLGTDHRFRIEHAQVLDSADIPRFRELGVVPSMQPTHATSDMPWAERRLGTQRVRFAYAWRSLLETGVHIAAGSDFPVEDPNPLLGLYAAVTREDANGNPPGGWHPEQRMTMEEALRAFTTWAAEAAFQEHKKGMIAPGQWADLVVLDHDVMNVSPESAYVLPSTKVVITFVGGTVVYQQNELAEVSHEIRR